MPLKAKVSSLPAKKLDAVCVHSTVPFCTASRSPNAGMSSPAAEHLDVNLPPDMSVTILANVSAVP